MAFSTEDDESELEVDIIKAKSKLTKRGKRYSCPRAECSAMFTRPYRLEEHLKVHSGEMPHKCQFKDCNKGFTRKQHLDRHIKSAHTDTLQNKEKIECPKCHMLLTTNQNLKKHIERKHNRQYAYTCRYCERGFNKKNQLAAHIALHTGDLPFRCSICDKAFPSSYLCTKHERNHKTYSCDICKKQYQKWSDVLKHKKENHARREHQCDICKKVFYQRHYILQHMRIHIENDTVFVCPHEDCQKYYTKEFNLSHHMKSVHGGLTFDCPKPDCSAKLSTKAKLKSHIFLHENPPKARKPKKPQQKRKDTGTKVKSSAIKLSGITVPLSVEKKIVQGNSQVIEEVQKAQVIPISQPLSYNPFESDEETRQDNPGVLYFSTDVLMKNTLPQSTF